MTIGHDKKSIICVNLWAKKDPVTLKAGSSTRHLEDDGFTGFEGDVPSFYWICIFLFAFKVPIKKTHYSIVQMHFYFFTTHTVLTARVSH